MTKKRIQNCILAALAIVAGFVLRSWCMEVVSGDMKYCLLEWYQQLEPMNLKTALVTQVGNYNMLYQLFIFILTRIPGDPMAKIKILSILFDLVLAAGVYFLASKLTTKRRAALCSLVVWFLPTVWINSAAWGQCDSMYVSLIIWALYCLYTKKTMRSFVLLGAALALKLQTVFILPFVGFLFLAERGKGRIRLYHFAALPGMLLGLAIPNFLAGRPIYDLIGIYLEQTDTYHDIYKNYPSLWALIPLKYDSDKLWAIGFTVLVLCGLMVLFYRKKAQFYGKHFLWIAFLLSYACVLCLPAMHERYGFLYEILAVLLAFTIGQGYVLCGMLQLLSIKTYISYLHGVPLNMTVLSLVNAAVFCIFLWMYWTDRKPLNLFARKADAEASVEPFRFRVEKRDMVAMALLVGGFLLVGSMRLGATKAPETSVCFDNAEKEAFDVFISLKQTDYVDSVMLYQGYSEKKSFSLFAAEDGQWVRIGEGHKTGYMFTWNRAEVGCTTHQLALVVPANALELGEIVVLGKNGKVLPLLDSDPYPALFDEQDTYLETPTYYNQTMFDEIYHGRTAYEFLHGLPIYENTHPPLGKSLISIGIALFGMNPFGYRIVVLLFGTMMLPFVYLFGLRLTGKREFALLAGCLLATECMHFTLARIATIDSIVAFFVLGMFYFLYAFLQEEKYRYLILSGSFFALGAATKWTALYGAVAMAICLFIYLIKRLRTEGFTGAQLRFVAICIGSFILLPAFVYVLSYIPFARVDDSQGILGHAISNSLHMLSYHEGAVQEHSYASAWYSWLIDWKPLVDARTSLGDKSSVVATFVNPFTCYAGLVAVFYNLYLSIRKKDREARLLLILYGCMLGPWIVIARTVFIYQYYICTLILILMICNSIHKLRFVKEKQVIKLTAAVSLGFFVLFFPSISGLEFAKNYGTEVLRWLPQWWL